MVQLLQLQVHSKACNELINMVCLAIQMLHALNLALHLDTSTAHPVCNTLVHMRERERRERSERESERREREREREKERERECISSITS